MLQLEDAWSKNIWNEYREDNIIKKKGSQDFEGNLDSLSIRSMSEFFLPGFDFIYCVFAVNINV